MAGMDWGALAQVGLSAASNYANSRNQARTQAAGAAQTQNAQSIQQNNSQNNVLLQMAQIELLRKQMEEQNRNGRAQQTARGDALANVQDVSISRPSHITDFNISGGMRPSALGPNARQAGAELSNQALAKLLDGDTFMPITPTGPVDLNANMPTESTFDKMMGAAGSVGNVWQAYEQQQKADAIATQTAENQGTQQRSLMELLAKVYGGQPQAAPRG